MTDRRFNFSPASNLDDVVHGAACPPPSELDAWCAFMQAAGIRRVVCLLDAEDLRRLYDGRLIETYGRVFDVVNHFPVKDITLPSEAALNLVLASLRDAEAAGAPIVVHCYAGKGRTGFVLAAWLRGRHDLDADDALRVVKEIAEAHGARRDPEEATGARERLQALPFVEGPPAAARRRPRHSTTGWSQAQAARIEELREKALRVWQTRAEVKGVLMNSIGPAEIFEVHVIRCSTHPELVGLVGFTYEEVGGTAGPESIRDYWKTIAGAEKIHVIKCR